jgi:hypothetical protein
MMRKVARFEALAPTLNRRQVDSGFSENLTQFFMQGVPPGHDHLNIGRIKLHSSMTFIRAYSVYSPLT